MTSVFEHIPVMVSEAIEYLNLKTNSVVVDATVGAGGHSLEIAKRLSSNGRLICIDRDEDSLAIARTRLKQFGDIVSFVHSDFRYIGDILNGLKIENIDGIIFDLGISSYQLEMRERGFSFRYDAPLDMRMDKAGYISAYDLVNNLTEKEISNILWSFGQERWHNRIARCVVRERERAPIATTAELRDLIVRAVSYRSARAHIHPATRTFQALRIAVNRELEALQEALNAIPKFMRHNARVCVISFHSLEDRIVKHNFKENSVKDIYTILTKKPLLPSQKEASDNPRARSAKLRAAQRK